jgi:hypothetical protein
MLSDLYCYTHSNEFSVHLRSQYNSVGVVTKLKAGRQRNRSSISKEDKKFSLLHSVQTRSGAHPASHIIGTGLSFPGDEAAGA